jgi:signal transduction histidine kinase
VGETQENNQIKKAGKSADRRRVDSDDIDLYEAAKKPSVGLSGMRESALLLGGKVVIDSKPGSGTSISAGIPISGIRPD